ncbi:MAG: AAA family ATPase [Deltaproteobacteria bacterium]|nr:AAA family ATPase [Deltaproteobacteria bacterium]
MVTDATQTETATMAPHPLDEARRTAAALMTRLNTAVIGRRDVVESIVIALLADGHVLLEDMPGSGKTTLAKTLGESIVDDRDPAERGPIESFRRIQFTPDLLPSDVTGTTVFAPQHGTFTFKPGPVFAHVVLADEINRTSPKVQAAMLEAMAEKQVTVDNRTHPLDALFFVIATQNPLDLAGTFPLPVAQLDRFLFKIRMTTIDRAAELEVLRTVQSRRELSTSGPPPVTRGQVLRARLAMLHGVTLHPLVQETLVDTGRALRADPRVLQGVSTRSLVLCLPALQARALLRDRDHVRADDVEAVLPLVFNHRVELAAGAVLQDVLRDALRAPLERLARATLGS